MKGKHAAAHAKKKVRVAPKESDRFENDGSAVPSSQHPSKPFHTAAKEPASVRPVQPAPNDADAVRAFDLQPEGAVGRRILKGVGIFFAIVFGLILAVYLAGVVIFMGRFYPNTTMGSLDVSLKSSAEAAAMLSDYVADDYSIAIRGDGFSLNVSSDECAMSIDTDSVVSAAIGDNESWLWPLKLNSSFDVTDYLQASCNDSELGAYLEERIAEFNQSAADPEDARVVYNDKAHRFAIKPETAGTKISSDAVMRSVAEAISEMEHEVQLDSSHLIQAAVKSDDESLISALDSANSLLSCDLALTLGGVEVVRLGPDLISGWVSFGEDGSVSIDEAARDEWISQTADTFSTLYKERTYTRPDGKQITVNAGTYGWLVDTDAFASLVADSISSGSTGSAEIPCSQTGNGYSSIGDWGSFCDIDLSEQHARFYDASGSLVWESDIVSGSPGADATPTGVYMCNNKMRNVSLKGPIDPETDKPRWDSPVAFWIPFIGNLIGLHDASWQPAFGGSLYANGYGSHGCVNLSYDAASSIYGLIQLGDAVIVHW